jgi:hypothetical protein
MVWFPISLIRESRLLGLEKKGFIRSREVLGWRLGGEGEVPHLRDDEVVVLASFYERGFGLPLHSFVRGLLHYYLLEVKNLHPNVVLHIVYFVTLCEAFMGIDPHWRLWHYFFSVRVARGTAVSCILAWPILSSILAGKRSTSRSLFLPPCGMKGSGFSTGMWLEAPHRLPVGNRYRWRNGTTGQRRASRVRWSIF